MRHHTNKEDPQTRPNEPTKPRHRPSDIRTHQAVHQRKAVARGGTGGSADPTWQLMRLSFGGKLDPILLKEVDDDSIQGDGGNRPLALYKGVPTTLSHTSLRSLSFYTLL